MEYFVDIKLDNFNHGLKGISSSFSSAIKLYKSSEDDNQSFQPSRIPS